MGGTSFSRHLAFIGVNAIGLKSLGSEASFSLGRGIMLADFQISDTVALLRELSHLVGMLVGHQVIMLACHEVRYGSLLPCKYYYSISL